MAHPLASVSETIGGKAMEMVSAPFGGSLFESLFSGDTASEALKVRETAQSEREGIFDSLWNVGGEVGESWLSRNFPVVSQIFDVAGWVIGNKDEEAFAWQNEFETLSALTMFIPDFLLRHMTDPIANSDIFIKILRNWPLGGDDFADRIESKGDPDDVIQAFRMIHQDLTTGKVSGDALFKHVISAIL